MWNELVREEGAKREGRVGARKYKDKRDGHAKQWKRREKEVGLLSG